MSTIDHHHRRVSRGFTLLALAAVLAVTAAALSRCRPVGDSVAGVDLTTANPKLNHRSDCVRQCNKDFNQAHTEEVERHAAALQDCAGDADCIAAENRFHQDQQHRLVKAMQNCKSSCYNEGGGGGGR